MGAEKPASEDLSRGKRLRNWLIAVVVAGLTAALTAVVTELISSAAHNVPRVIHGLMGGTPSGKEINVSLKTASGPTIALIASQGMGCPPAQGWIYPYPPQKMSNLPPGKGMRMKGRTWDRDPLAFGAVPADPVTLFIYTTSRLNHAIILTNLRIHVTSRRVALRGTRLNIEEGCGAAGTFRYGKVDLDLRPPYWVAHAKLPAYMRADALKFPYTVTPNSPEALYISVTTKRCYCRWYAELDWIDGRVIGHTDITDHGHSFAITAHAGVPASIWFGSKRIQFLPSGGSCCGACRTRAAVRICTGWRSC